MKKTILYVIIAVIVAGGIGFYAGMQAGKGSTILQNSPGVGGNFQGRTGLPAQAGMQNGRQQSFSGQGNGGFAGGEILSMSDTSITLKSNDGSSRIVIFSDATKITKSVGGSKGDLVAGAQVTVQGTPNSDGSITAQMIQLRPVTATSTPSR